MLHFLGARPLVLLFAIAVAKASVSVTRTSNDGPHPSSMEIEVQLPNSNKKVRIPLTKTDPLENTPMTVTENGISRTFSARQAQNPDNAHYRNIETRSVISVRHENGKKRIKGHVMHEGTSYFVEPSGEFEHRVTINIAKLDGIKSHVEIMSNAETLKRKKRQSNQAATEFEVELLILCDHTVWNTFKSIFVTYERAMTELYYYYAHILNGIDTVYRNMVDPQMSVKCIGLTVAITEADSKWMPQTDDWMDGSDANAILRTIADYAKDKTSDHVMAFTRVDIHIQSDSSAIGMAIMSNACQQGRVSIIEDVGLHSWGTAAHELAHNLGAEHDNDEPGCGISDNYLLSPYAAMYQRSDIANSYRFSKCTAAAIRNYLSTQRAHCLRSRQSATEMALTTSIREGTRLTLDNVCRLAYPSSPGYFFLRSEFNESPGLICVKIYCSPEEGSSSGVTNSGLRAPVGSHCGNRKSCNWNGECVTDSTAPAADESCFWGDTLSDGCPFRKEYIKYLRDKNMIMDAKYYCSKWYNDCCRSINTLCTF